MCVEDSLCLSVWSSVWPGERDRETETEKYVLYVTLGAEYEIFIRSSVSSMKYKLLLKKLKIHINMISQKKRMRLKYVALADFCL